MCPPIPAFPILFAESVASGDLSGHGRGGGCVSGKSSKPYRIPSSPVVGQEPARSEHLPKRAACQAEGVDHGVGT
jgi:hypothetical protein